MTEPRPPQALLLDAAGTLLHPAEPVARTYARTAAAHGVQVDEETVRQGFRRAFGRPRAGPLRYEGDGRPFWREVVAEATGSDSPALFEELYAWYGTASAWRVDPGLLALLEALPRHDCARALVSNWDLRLRPLLAALRLSRHFEVLSISAEVGAEKPEARIFHHTCQALGVAPALALHVGDSEEADVQGARAAGLRALHWGGEPADLGRLHRALGRW